MAQSIASSSVPVAYGAGADEPSPKRVKVENVDDDPSLGDRSNNFSDDVDNNDNPNVDNNNPNVDAAGASPGTTLNSDDAPESLQKRVPGLPRSQKKLQRRENDYDHMREKRKKMRQKTRHNKADARREMLSSMTEEERRDFIKKEHEEKDRKKAETEERMKTSYREGRPRIVINCSFCGGEEKINTLVTFISEFSTETRFCYKENHHQYHHHHQNRKFKLLN
jgi:hypothetical protein